MYELTVYCCFVFRCICCRFLFFCCRGLFLLQGKYAKKVVLHHMQQAGALEFLHHHEMLLHNCEAFYTTVRMAPQADGFCRSGRIDLLLAQKYELLQSNSRLLVCERVMETRAEFHFSWVYTFSATLSSLRNWANNGRCRLLPSTPAQLCWSSSRLQPLQNYNLITFALIRPSTLNHDRNVWNFRGAPDKTTCLTGFFRCPSALILLLHEIV